MKTTYDFAPLYRSSIGFDQLFDLLEGADRLQPIDSWPPYNIEKTGEDQYRVTVAVAGFSEEDLDVTVEPKLLIVRGERQAQETQGDLLHHGLQLRPFERRFELADHVEVESADLRDGLLTIELTREVPEAMRPKTIPLTSGDSGDSNKQIEHEVERRAA